MDVYKHIVTTTIGCCDRDQPALWCHRGTTLIIGVFKLGNRVVLGGLHGSCYEWFSCECKLGLLVKLQQPFELLGIYFRQLDSINANASNVSINMCTSLLVGVSKIRSTHISIFQ